jgi:hypothetical protein
MRLLPSLVVCALSGLAVPARADTTATTSMGHRQVLGAGDHSDHLFPGAGGLGHVQAQGNYRWGGLQCKGRELSDTSIQLLFAAFRSEYQVTLEYVVADYKGKPYRCITGLTISKT